MPSFFLSEFYRSQTATRKRIDNTPTPEAMENVRRLLAPGMQRIRELLGAPVSISSGYRSAALNREIGGAVRSQHSQGLAADFTAPGFGRPLAICRKLIDHRELIGFDQLIMEGGAWVHVSFTAKPRGQVLTATFTAHGAVYQPGLPAD